MLNNKTILVTESSEFIGSNLCLKLLSEFDDAHIVRIDNMNDYYDVSLKEYRLKKIEELNKDFKFIKGNIADKEFINKVFKENKIDYIAN